MLFKYLSYFLITFSCFFSFLFSNPWGKDADLLQNTNTSPKVKIQGPGIRFAEIAIGFFRDYISPADGPRSHYFPSSSKYTLDAIREYGFWEGFLLGSDRLLRENNADWVYPTIIKEGYRIKHDPIKKLHSIKTVKPHVSSPTPANIPHHETVQEILEGVIHKGNQSSLQ
ncbi:MAG: hypothetical protein CMO81_12265 [Waddliaceae bacterium]|nr:hypothetical protein [Waddliaceae bacterium]